MSGGTRDGEKTRGAEDMPTQSGQFRSFLKEGECEIEPWVAGLCNIYLFCFLGVLFFFDR